MIDRGALGWGSAFVALGGWRLLEEVSAGVVRPSAVAMALLVAGAVLGVHGVARGGRGLVLPAVLLLAGGALALRDVGALELVPVWPLALIVAGLVVLAAGRRGRGVAAPQTASLALDGADTARLVVDHGAGTLRLRGGAEPGQLLAGTFDGGVVHEVDHHDGHVDVRLRPAADHLWGRTRGLDWDVAVTDTIPVTLQLRTGAGQLRLDCSQLTVPRLELSTGASDVDVILPAHGRTSVKIAAGAADVRVHAPAGVAASVGAHTGLAGVHVDTARFPRHNGRYRSADYDTAADRADVELEGGVASFSVD